MIQEQIRIRELEAALEANRTLLALESHKVRSVQTQLICIGQELGGAQFDQFMKDHLENDLTMEALTSEIIGLVRVRLGFTSSPAETQSMTPPSHRDADGRTQLETQTGRVMQAEADAAECRKQTAAFEKSLHEARRTIQELEADRQAGKIPPTGGDHSAWFEQWQKQKDFERTREILLLFVRSSLELVRQIEKTLAGQNGESPVTVPEGIKVCCQEGLLELTQVKTLNGGSKDLVTLTRKGLWAYTRIMQSAHSRAENASLIKPYRTDPQTSLVLRTAELFTRLGYAVDRKPERIGIDAGHGFQPDLVVSRQGETFFLQVESDQVDDRPALVQKWEQALLVGGGQICLVTGQLASMNSLQSQVIHWATQNGNKCRLYLTNTDFLKWVPPGKSPWARIREL